MIQFFRKIRQQLLSENRFSKYLIYAVGEIVLVVIGILIALNLNNRNEQRKTEAKVEIIFNDIMEELISDIEETRMPMEYFALRDSTIHLVLSDSVDFDNYWNGNLPWINQLTSWHNPVNLTQHAYDNLTSDLDMVPSKYKSVIKELNILYSYNKDFVIAANTNMSDFINDTQTYGMKNHPWWNMNNEANFKASIDYKLNDWRYKNRVLEYRTLGIGNQLRMSVMYRNKAIECYGKIAELLDKPTSHESFSIKKEIAQKLVGDWQLADHPDVIFSFVLKENRLYSYEKEEQQAEIYGLSRNKILMSDTQYATIVRENNETFLKFNSYRLQKMD